MFRPKGTTTGDGRSEFTEGACGDGGRGDVPTWTASLLTGGSLLLGFSILRHDRRALERAQIDRVGVWVEGVRIDDHNAGIGVHLHNASDLPIKGILVEASAVVVYRGCADRALLRTEQREDVLRPGGAVDRVMPFPPAEQARSMTGTAGCSGHVIEYVAARPDAVRISDNAGRLWTMGRDEMMRLSRRPGAADVPGGTWRPGRHPADHARPRGVRLQPDSEA